MSLLKFSQRLNQEMMPSSLNRQILSPSERGGLQVKFKFKVKLEGRGRALVLGSSGCKI